MGAQGLSEILRSVEQPHMISLLVHVHIHKISCYMWQDTTKLDYSLIEQEVVGRINSQFSVCSALQGQRMIQFDRLVPTHMASAYVCGNPSVIPSL